MAWLYVILAIIVIALVIVIANLKIVPQSKAYVIERLGSKAPAPTKRSSPG